MVDVVRNVDIPWDPDSEDITISTDYSVIGSGERVRLTFFNGNNQVAGGVMIIFYSPMMYKMPRCSSPTPFPVSPPAETVKTWKISYEQAALRLTIHCNEVEVLNVALTDGCTRDGWRDFWVQKKPTKIKFNSGRDTASDQYQ